MRAPLLAAGTALWAIVAGPFADTPATAKETLRLAYVLEASTQASVYAIEAGKVTSDLIDVKVNYLGIAAIDQAPATRQYDVLQTATLSVPRAILQGIPIKALAVTLRNSAENLGNGVWVPKDSPVKTMADLKGKTIGAFALNSSGLNNIRLAIFKKYGMNVSYDGGDFKWVEVPSTAMAAAATSGRIDAATFLSAQAQQYAVSGEFRLIMHGSRELKETTGVEIPSGMLIAYSDRLDAKPELYLELLRMIRASVQYLRDHESEVFEAMAVKYKMSAADVKNAFYAAGVRPFEISKEDYRALEITWKGYQDIGILKDIPPIDRMVWQPAVGK